MVLQEYIINDIDPIDINEPVVRVQDIFSQFPFSHIPVIENEIYVGCVSETDAHAYSRSQSLDQVRYDFELFFVRENDHWLDVLEAFARYTTNVMPVLDEKNMYIGYYELKDIMHFFNESPFMADPGAVIVVEKGTVDYSFSEIAQIIESNDSKIYGCFISGYRDHFSQVTLKITTSSLNEILQTFRRYGYDILTAAQDDAYLDTLKERSDYLSKYLEL